MELLIIGAAIALMAQSQSDAGDHPRDPTDVVLISDSGPRNGVYLIDSSARAVYFHSFPEPPGRTTVDLTLDEFTLFARIPDVRRPSSLAYHDGKLYVLDPETAMIKWISLEDRSVRDLQAAPYLRSPTALAVSDYGEIAVADEGLHAIVRISPKGDRAMRQYNNLGAQTRVTFDQKSLLMLDKEDDGRLFRQASADSIKLVDGQQFEGKIRDITSQRGVLYLAATGGVAVYTPDTLLLRIEVRLKSSSDPNQSIVANPDRISASENALAALCRKQGIVRILPRPIPVQATLEGGQASNNRALAQLYEYLDQEQLLPTYKVSVGNGGMDLQTLLLHEWILLPGSPKASGTQLKWDMDLQSEAKFRKIFCRHNATLCSARDPAKFAGKHIWPGQSIIAPQVYVMDAATNTERNSNPPPSPTPATDPYSLRGELEQRGGFFPALPPASELMPGVAVQVDGGRVRLMDRRSICWATLKAMAVAEPVAMTLPANLKLPIAATSLPTLITRDTLLQDPAKAGVSSIVVTFSGVERKALQADPAATLGSTSGKCPSEFANDARTALVSEALVAASAKYTLRISPASLTTQRIQDLQTKLANRQVSVALLADGIELSVRQPMSLAFQAVPAREAAVSLESAVPWNPRNLASWNVNPSNKSHFRWLLTFLAPAHHVNDGESGLRKLEADNDDLYIWSAQLQPAEPQALGLPAPPEGAAESVAERALTQRQALMSRIGYPPTLPDLSRLAVGILENGTDVNAHHVAFCADKKTLWIEGLGGFPDDCSTGADVADEYGKPTATDHGTHVAGMFSTGPRSAVPGLLPTARLGLIDTLRPTTMESQMHAAIDEGVIVFNFSGSVAKEAEANWASMKKKLRKDWQDRLLVVAAGNEGADLSISAPLPIQWVKDDPWKQNLIGVGAADASLHRLSTWNDDDGNPHTGSNWKREYVQLLADGKDVVSTINGHSYGTDTGTSMAAPQVAAAAVLLQAAGVREPNRIKARLMSTANWDTDYEGVVSAGYLNVERAAWMPQKTVIKTQSEPRIPRFVEDLKTPELRDRITVEPGGTCQRMDSTPCEVPASLAFETILRIQRIVGPENRFRVWFVDTPFKFLTVLDDVTLSGGLRYARSETWDSQQRKLIALDPQMISISVSQIYDYVASESRIPATVRF